MSTVSSWSTRFCRGSRKVKISSRARVGVIPRSVKSAASHPPGNLSQGSLAPPGQTNRFQLKTRQLAFGGVSSSYAPDAGTGGPPDPHGPREWAAFEPCPASSTRPALWHHHTMGLRNAPHPRCAVLCPRRGSGAASTQAAIGAQEGPTPCRLRLEENPFLSRPEGS